MRRCRRTGELEVHHKRRNGGNNLSNAEVLCKTCHTATSTYGAPGKTPPAFIEETKSAALKRARHQCECARSGGCH